MPLFPKVYLDYNATSPVKPAVITRMTEVFAIPYNASSVHNTGREAKRLIDDARQKILETLGAPHGRLIFTSSGTEANNLALRGVAGYRVIVVETEHVSVLKAREDAVRIAVDANGIIDLVKLEEALKASDVPALVSVMLVNNETGVIQPVRDVVELVHRYNGLVHTDASQACGKIPVLVHELGVDMLTLSGHKFGGPQGAAALLISPCVDVKAQLLGGGQESSYRAGTENTAAIIGLGIAVERLSENITAMTRLQKLQAYLERELKSHAPAVQVIGQNTARVGNTSCITMPNVQSETQLIHFDMQGIAVSAGSACSSGRVEPSHVVAAMGVAPEEARCAIRISTGLQTEEKDIDHFIKAWKMLYDRTHLQHQAA